LESSDGTVRSVVTGPWPAQADPRFRLQWVNHWRTVWRVRRSGGSGTSGWPSTA